MNDLTGIETGPSTAMPGHSSKPYLTVVAPCFNEEEVIQITHERLKQACLKAVGEDHQIIYVNDGSSDRTWHILESISRAEARVLVVKLSRNFGHQAALTAGLHFAAGQRILMIDADLQDPPELLPGMLAKMDEGYDVVYGQRIAREGETAFKKSSASLFYRLLTQLTDINIPQDTGDFRLVSRRCLQAMLQLPEQHRFVRGMVAWLGFRQAAFPYHRQARVAGTTKYPLKKMLRLATDAITGFSTRPLRITIYFALLAFLSSVGLTIYALAAWLMFDVVKGWTSLLIVISMTSAANFLCLGIFGEYLGRLFMESKRRPIFIVEEVAGFQPLESRHFDERPSTAPGSVTA